MVIPHIPVFFTKRPIYASLRILVAPVRHHHFLLNHRHTFSNTVSLLRSALTREFGEIGMRCMGLGRGLELSRIAARGFHSLPPDCLLFSH